MTRIPDDYQRIERAIAFLDAHFREQPRLRDVARAAGLSAYHFQRLFRRWAGVSPKRFVQFLTAEYARGLLMDSHNVLRTSYEAGLSGPGRLHDLMVSVHAGTPAEVASGGAGLVIHYGFHASPFGACLLAVTARGVCGLAFAEPDDRDQVLAELRARWPRAQLIEDDAATAPVARRIFSRDGSEAEASVSLFLHGTNFQLKVWEALLRIPAGNVTSYEDIAHAVGAPRAARAVGAAVARNPVAYLIPCHRVIRKTGAFGDYHWGATRKRALLAWEAARAQSAAPDSRRRR